MNLEQLRLKKGITRIQASIRLGVSLASMQRYEKGQTPIPGSMLPNLIKLYNLTAEQAIALVAKEEVAS